MSQIHLSKVQSAPRSTPRSTSSTLPVLPLKVRPKKETLGFPELMDPAAVAELERRGFDIVPAFRLRGQSDVVFDLELDESQSFAWQGGIVAHTWFVASPGELPRLGFDRGETQNRFGLNWSEPESSTLEARRRLHRYVEFHHRGEGPAVPLVVIAKPDPLDSAPFSVVRENAPGLATADACSTAVFRISFRWRGGELRPWFDLFEESLFPPGLEPEPVLIPRTDGATSVRLELVEGEFVANREAVDREAIDQEADMRAAPRIRWYDTDGFSIEQPPQVKSVSILGRSQLALDWVEPQTTSTFSFDVLCRLGKREIWLDPTIFHKGIGPGIAAE